MTAQLKKYTFTLLLLWFSAGMLSLAWNIYDNQQEHKELALQATRTFLSQLQNTRAWISAHDGIYVPVTENRRPSPHLNDDPKRDLTTAGGTQLTKISPATVIRELSAITSINKGAEFHITSLNPINPENLPYAWEKPWLLQFSTDAKERSTIVREDGKTIFRFMAPIISQRDCQACHVEKNYPIGEVRGGISITLPMEQGGLNWPLLLSHFGPMAAGTLLILFFSSKLNAGRSELLSLNQSLIEEIRQRREAQDKLQESKDQLETRVMQRTSELRLMNEQLEQKIHQREHIEDALTMIYNEFYQLFNSAPDGMLVVDEEFNILRINQAFARFIGLESNKIIGQKCFDIFFGSTCHTDSCPLQAIVEGKRRFEVECEKRVSTKDRNIPCIVTSTPFREADGTLIGAIMVAIDITTRRQTEQALEGSAKKLKESNQALEDFAHIISHDLQEPLMLIQGFSNRLQGKAGVDLNKQCNRYIEQINSAAGRMRELITGLLLYSRVSYKTEPFTEVDLSLIIDGVLEDLALQTEKSQSTIFKDKLPVIWGDPLQIRQLFQNLIGNSLKYRRKDTPHEMHIKNQGMAYCKDGLRFVQISISDNGLGFRPEDGDHIFDIFERLQGDKKEEGTGIGLAICKKIIERHGGSIRASGQPEQGAEFTIRLPQKTI